MDRQKIKESFTESFELEMPVLHQSMFIFNPGLSSLHVRAEYKVPDDSNSNQNIGISCTSKPK